VNSFTLNWTLDASPAEVFAAWTDPAELGWFFNDGQAAPDVPIEVDLRVGGAWRQLMVHDETNSYWTGGVYRELVPGKRLVFSWGAEGGWPELDPDRPELSPTVTVVLAAEGATTEMTVLVELPDPAPVDAGVCHTGWQVTIDRLARQLGRPVRSSSSVTESARFG
jgi:uncharacterized protein YndB with AHSA1/START domain